MSADRPRPVDVDRARLLIEELERVLDSVRYTPPEMMGERRIVAADLLNQLADAFGLEGERAG